MIVVPFTLLQDETLEALPGARFVEMTTEHSYRELLGELWARGEAFTLVEHDVIPTRAQLDALESCPEAWCHYGYFPGHWIPVFGCARFGEELIAGTPGAWEDESWPWEQLDMKFATVARARGFSSHWHSPHVRHGRTHFNDAGGPSRREADEGLQLMLLEREVKALREEATR